MKSLKCDGCGEEVGVADKAESVLCWRCTYRQQQKHTDKEEVPSQDEQTV